MAGRDDWAVVPLLRLGCTPDNWVSAGGRAACRDWYRWALHQVGQLHPSVVLLGGSIGERWTPAARAAADGVIAAATALEALGTTVVIGDPEGLDENPVDCLLARGASMTELHDHVGALLAAGVRRCRSSGEAARRRLLPTRGFVCSRRRCPAVIGRTIAWMDNNHLTAAYSAQLAGAFEAGLREAVPTARR